MYVRVKIKALLQILDWNIIEQVYMRVSQALTLVTQRYPATSVKSTIELVAAGEQPTSIVVFAEFYVGTNVTSSKVLGAFIKKLIEKGR